MKRPILFYGFTAIKQNIDPLECIIRELFPVTQFWKPYQSVIRQKLRRTAMSFKVTIEKTVQHIKMNAISSRIVGCDFHICI